MQIKGVFFDMDGTLIDTNELIFQSYDYALHKVLHTSYPREHLVDTFGKPLKQIMEELGGAHAEELRHAFLEYSLAHEEQLRLFPAVRETLQWLKEQNIAMAIVSSRLRKGVLRDLSLFGLDTYFDVLITPESTDKHKPHPDPAHKAAEALHLSPEQTLFVGDSPYDLRCGRDAGCKTAIVSYSLFSPQVIEPCTPDYTLDTLADLRTILAR